MEMYRTRYQFNFMFGKYYVMLENKNMCLKINFFFHSSTIKLQCMNLSSIHVARRGQSPNNKAIIMRNYFNTLCFVGKKIAKKYDVCMHSINFPASSVEKSIVTKTPCVPSLTVYRNIMWCKIINFESCRHKYHERIK